MNHQTYDRRLNWLIASLGACCILGGWFFWTRTPPSVISMDRVEDRVRAASSTIDLIDSRVFLPAAIPFWTESISSKPCSSITSQPILILPHYAPVYKNIEQTLLTWKSCRDGAVAIKRVVVIGPDHHHRLEKGLSTLSADGYRSPLGDIFVDKELRASLVRLGITDEKNLYTTEHSVGLFPVFIKRHFPEATFTPIVISSTAKKEELMPIVNVIKKEIANGDTLVIITADFSHYLSKEIADARDLETRQAFDQRNLGFFWSATDDYTDFGRGIWFGWQLAGTASEFDIVDQMNSVDVGGPRMNTTSFFFGWWD